MKYNLQLTFQYGLTIFLSAFLLFQVQVQQRRYDSSRHVELTEGLDLDSRVLSQVWEQRCLFVEHSLRPY
jgi:hypothetical protein